MTPVPVELTAQALREINNDWLLNYLPPILFNAAGIGQTRVGLAYQAKGLVNIEEIPPGPMRHLIDYATITPIGPNCMKGVPEMARKFLDNLKANGFTFKHEYRTGRNGGDVAIVWISW